MLSFAAVAVYAAAGGTDEGSARASAVLRLQHRSNASAGHPSVRFRSCSRTRDRLTGYPGGLVYTGPWPACVPLDVTVAGSPTSRHLASLGAGRCR